MTRFSPSACGGLRIALSNVEVMLRWSGALWLEREGALVLSAPPDCETDVMAEFVHEKLEWIYGKLALKGLIPSDAVRLPLVAASEASKARLREAIAAYEAS